MHEVQELRVAAFSGTPPDCREQPREGRRSKNSSGHVECLSWVQIFCQVLKKDNLTIFGLLYTEVVREEQSGNRE